MVTYWLQLIPYCSLDMASKLLIPPLGCPLLATSYRPWTVLLAVLTALDLTCTTNPGTTVPKKHIDRSSPSEYNWILCDL